MSRALDVLRYGTGTALAALIAFLLPFERLGSFDVGGLTVRPSQLALLAALALILREIVGRRVDFPGALASEWRLLCLFLAAAALSLTNAENLGRSLVVLGFTTFTALLTLSLSLLIRSRTTLIFTRQAILVSAALVGLFGLWQFFGDMLGLPETLTGLRSHYGKAILGFTRVQSTASEPLYFASYLLLPLSLGLAWLMQGAERARSWLVPLMLLLFTNLALTSSRGGYGGALAAAGTLAIIYHRKGAYVRRFALAAVGAALAGLVAVAMVGRFSATTPEALSAVFLRHVSTLTDGAAFDERAVTLRYGLEAFLAHPFIGVGIGGFGPYIAPFPHVMPDAGWPIVNNEPVELLAETGLIGFAAFLLFLIAVFRRGIESHPDAEVDVIRAGALAALAGHLVQYQTFSTLYVMHVWFTIGLLLAASRIPKPSST